MRILENLDLAYSSSHTYNIVTRKPLKTLFNAAFFILLHNKTSNFVT